MASVPARIVRLFRNGRNQAVRIPRDLELPGDEALLRRDGDRLILEPAQGSGLAALLERWAAEGSQGIEFPEIDDPPPRDKPVF